MRWLAAAVLLLMAGDERTFEVRGTVTPAVKASVSLHGATTPFETSKLSEADGRFKFTKIAAGSYTVVVFVPGVGEKRMTIDVGPVAAAKRGWVEVAVKLEETGTTPDRSAIVTMRELTIPKKAWDEYREAENRLGRRDIEGALEHLRKAVQVAPQFAAAWNHMGTIAYQTQRYADAEADFRTALNADPEAYEPLVNLGGVLVTVGRFEEAWKYNLHAVLRRPNDALAQSQMGMTYYGLGKLPLAEQYLLEAQRLDAGHFSHPQLLLAEIYLKMGAPEKAADQLEDFLKHHPDWPEAGHMREMISKLRGSPKI